MVRGYTESRHSMRLSVYRYILLLGYALRARRCLHFVLDAVATRIFYTPSPALPRFAGEGGLKL